ncbi:MAG: response regulator [Bacteroidota bacterium]
MGKIVLQENDRDILEVLTAALEMEGFDVYAILSLDESILKIINKTRPHIVVLDYRLSGKDCIDICYKIKAANPHLPVVAISCNTNIQEQYSQGGFDGYIEKPFDLDLLFQVLHTHIKESGPAKS